jgi:hypothetical protein
VAITSRLRSRPALFQILSYSHVLSYRHHKHADKDQRTDLMAAYFDDVQWDGEAIVDDEPTTTSRAASRGSLSRAPRAACIGASARACSAKPLRWQPLPRARRALRNDSGPVLAALRSLL